MANTKLYIFLLLIVATPCFSHSENAPTIWAEHSKKPSWLKLVHYKKNTLAGYTSIVDDPNFFLAKNGKSSPEDELGATFNLFVNDSPESKQQRCKFPARRKLLINFGLLKEQDALLDHCDDYWNWRNENDTESVWVIFPSAFLNSPSSMFGHTLFRFDARENNGNTSKLLSKAVNYAAKIDKKPNGFTYAFKGLFGGYPGYFSIMPYYEKVRDYNRIENRDIWEYQLNLTQDEIDWLLAHLWELDRIRFDYFFTTQNCSYQLLALLDFLRPEKNLLDGFEWVAIPVETIRALHDQGWIVDQNFRASKVTEFHYYLDALNKQEREIVASFKHDSADDIISKLQSFPKDRQQLILETGYKLVRIEKNAKKDRKKSIQLLRYRSKLGKREESVVEKTPSPPEEGHLSRRLGLGYYHTDNLDFGLIDIKLAYHSIEDPLPGFQKNSQINFLHGVVYFHEDDVKLEKFDVLNIRSLSTTDRYISRRAWQVNAGWERQLFENNEEYLTRQLSFGFGKVYNLGGVSFYGMLGAKAELFNSTQNDYAQLGPKLDVGVLYQSDKFSYEINSNISRMIESDLERGEASFTGSVAISRNLAVNVSVSHEKTNLNSKKNEGKLQLNLFF